MQINKYLLLLTYLGQSVYAVIACTGLRASAQIRGVIPCCLHWIQSFWSRGQTMKAGEHLSNKYEIRIFQSLRIISGRHVDRRQVLSTFDPRPSRASPVNHTHRPALCTARRRLGVTQRVRRAVRWCQPRLV